MDEQTDQDARFVGLDIPALVRLVEQYRAQGDSDGVAAVERYLRETFPPQHVTGVLHSTLPVTQMKAG